MIYLNRLAPVSRRPGKIVVVVVVDHLTTSGSTGNLSYESQDAFSFRSAKTAKYDLFRCKMVIYMIFDGFVQKFVLLEKLACDAYMPNAAKIHNAMRC